MSVDSIHFCMNEPAASSASVKDGAVQPPYLKSLDLSSSGPPGACMTPSRVMNSWTIIFLMKSTPSQVLGDGRKAMPKGSLLADLVVMCPRQSGGSVSSVFGST